MDLQDKDIIFMILCLFLFSLYISFNFLWEKFFNFISKTFFSHKDIRKSLTPSELDLFLKLKKIGRSYGNLYVSKNLSYTQIDVVLLHKSGLWGFEVKDYSGLILANIDSHKWFKFLSKNRYEFYNPFMQNKAHVDALRSYLKEFPNLKIYSVVIFYGNCQVKLSSKLRKDCILTTSGKINYLFETIRKKDQSVNFKDRLKIHKLLLKAQMASFNKKIVKEHLKNVSRLTKS